MLKKSLVAAAAVAMVFGTAGLAQANSDLHIVQGAEVTIPPATGSFAGNAAATATCPAGETLTGGGANVTAGNSYTQNYQLASSLPNGNQQWWAYATNMDPNAPGKLRAYAICAKVSNVDVVTAP
ncbi:hypothetical protein ACIPWY_32025 [Streptomyces sp. NPDC090032]|uniref:hypothetical protein n=1 Tax=Streptomyces sp. NPDC090032 TaxID=3365925 RepID=UPI003826812B